jgi:hypothetical protein
VYNFTFIDEEGNTLHTPLWIKYKQGCSCTIKELRFASNVECLLHELIFSFVLTH